MKKVFTLFFILLSIFSYSQKSAPQGYLSLIQKAESFFLQKEYKKSALTYSAAFKEGKYKIYSFDFYNAGCAWALCGNSDSAFANLYRIVNPGIYTDHVHISGDFDLISLRNDKRWLPLINKVKENSQKKTGK